MRRNHASSRSARGLQQGSGPSAIDAREVDALVSRLLAEIRIPCASVGKRTLVQAADLKRVLLADYDEAPGLPDKPLLKTLSGLVEKEIKSPFGNLPQWGDPESFAHLNRVVGRRELSVRAHPYTEGAGLSLRGFFCRAVAGGDHKFVIFLNTAHHPGAVAATFGHEIGHYIYGSLMGEREDHTAFMEGTFGDHLLQREELFADSLVAFAGYGPEMIREIGPLGRIVPGTRDESFERIRRAYRMIAERYKLDLERGRMGAAWRVRYLTSMTHFLKLRSTLAHRFDL